MSAIINPAPLVVHLIFRLDFGGLETLLVECVNHIPPNRYRHAIICLTDFTEFSNKITQPGVEIYALHKPPGLGFDIHIALWKLLRKLRPTILHTYNLATIEYTFTAALAGVPIRIHAEHGRDMADPEGKNTKHNFLRRHLAPLIDRYVPVSSDLQQWLTKVVRIPVAKQLLINNGVDTEKFQPNKSVSIPASPWTSEHLVIGTVGRIQDIKNHSGLVRSFQRLQQLLPQHKDRLRLSIIGDGPLLPTLKMQVEAAGLSNVVWLPGARADVTELMHSFTLFTLPSLAEGTPVTLLEAMACGLPVVASHVGGIPEVISDQIHGSLVPAADEEALANALANYIKQPELATRHGAAACIRIEQKYSLTSMLNAYTNLYDVLCKEKFKHVPLAHVIPRAD
ncbi:TIGR03088 family PEP-CTERM/XrtA system glycosyltransferase [Solimicrobium silvestre]|uniref:Stp2: sugar transferase, PEP-CTERM/EpsH1 system associated n=1 Tax=Solimicrobium silvestre TaxID=2099400 RepID=A0A2S9H0Z8_9BURK|nr:TIGR03088 family PEP-CTERM/XrtA system glycosyltransferase [Solimicrobium silvestre]PRC93536.1 stp2: sugar transferase, PEP-CTERM/EpsH1 system associated [Solimicrobium silvestre]